MTPPGRAEALGKGGQDEPSPPAQGEENTPSTLLESKQISQRQEKEDLRSSPASMAHELTGPRQQFGCPHTVRTLSPQPVLGALGATDSLGAQVPFVPPSPQLTQSSPSCPPCQRHRAPRAAPHAPAPPPAGKGAQSQNEGQERTLQRLQAWSTSQTRR